MLATLLSLIAMPTAPARINHHPIVLVGGFTAWGRNEALGLKYWGGMNRDIQEDLKSHGFETVTAAVGPLSSNWDRACELYAILKGGRVDYGAAHAKTHGHARFGRTYPGLLPQWGEATKAGDIKKAHLVGHSMGGQTIRVLSHLLAEGSPEECAAAADASPLFRGHKAWVATLTTLATPHDGTTLVWKREVLLQPAQRFFAMAARMNGGRTPLYDLKLEHWASPEEARQRLEHAPLANTQDFAPYTLSPEGAKNLNAWVHLQPQVLHFSWSTAKTEPDIHGHHVPKATMTQLWHRGARFMGKTCVMPGHPHVDESWFQNDGVVNTRSMAGPSSEPIHPFKEAPRKGVWNHMGVLQDWDHAEIIGMGKEHGKEVLPFYRQWAAFLGSLEP